MAVSAGAGAVVAASDSRRLLWSVLATALGLSEVSALEVYTPKEIFVTNGTQGKLTCTFRSSSTTSKLTSVSWSFQPEGSDATVSAEESGLDPEVTLKTKVKTRASGEENSSHPW